MNLDMTFLNFCHICCKFDPPKLDPSTIIPNEKNGAGTYLVISKSFLNIDGLDIL